jgi:hypothetical protein
MSRRDRFREELSSPLSEETLNQRAAEGWRPVVVEWERVDSTAGHGHTLEAVPYGLKVAPDHVHLEENHAEVEVMLSILEGIVADWPMSHIAAELNRRGALMRNGMPWSQSEVFDLLPRLIEFGSRLFNRDEWIERRRILRRVSAAL